MQPILFIIGAQRSGSTALATVFEAYGAFVLGTRPPESRLLLRSEDPGRQLRRIADEADATTSGTLIVEKSTTYMEKTEAAYAASQVAYAEAIAILRNPVSRAISNYWFTRSNGIEKFSIEAAFEADSLHREWDEAKFSTNPFAYLQRSAYSTLLEPWIDALGPRLHILILEELVESPESPSALTLRNLGPDPGLLSIPRRNSSSGHPPPSGELRSRLSLQLLQEVQWVEQFLQRPMMTWRNA